MACFLRFSCMRNLGIFRFPLLLLPLFLFMGTADEEAALKKKAAEDYRKNFQETEIATPEQLAWSGKKGQCRPGKIPGANYTRLLQRINYFRRLAGVHDDITFDSAWCKYAQAAALIMYSNDQLTHNPGPSMKCYSADGKLGAQTSNLSSMTDESMKLMIADEIEDGGAENAETGHRRWLLYSKSAKMGIGVTPGAYAVRVMRLYDEKTNDTATYHGAVPGYFAYPFRGYVPYQVVYPKWSFAVPGGADFSSAKVEATAGEKPLSCMIIARGKIPYGDPTLVWTVKGLKVDFDYNYYDMATKKAEFEKRGLLDKKITVKISNVKVDGKVKSYSYSFTIFDPAQY
jgi:hypothetical protein